MYIPKQYILSFSSGALGHPMQHDCEPADLLHPALTPPRFKVNSYCYVADSCLSVLLSFLWWAFGLASSDQYGCHSLIQVSWQTCVQVKTLCWRCTDTEHGDAHIEVMMMWAFTRGINSSPGPSFWPRWPSAGFVLPGHLVCEKLHVVLIYELKFFPYLLATQDPP
jgi:hypothetical protein